MVNYIVQTTEEKLGISKIRVYGNWDKSSLVYTCDFETSSCEHVSTEEVTYDFKPNEK